MTTTIKFTDREQLIMDVLHIKKRVYPKEFAQKCRNPEHTWQNTAMYLDLYTFTPPFENVIHHFCRRCTKNIVKTWSNRVVVATILVGDKWAQSLFDKELREKGEKWQKSLKQESAKTAD